MILYSGFRQYVSSWALMAVLFRTKCVGFSNYTLDLGCNCCIEFGPDTGKLADTLVSFTV